MVLTVSNNSRMDEQLKLASKFLSFINSATVSQNSSTGITTVTAGAPAPNSPPTATNVLNLSGNSDDWNITTYANGDIKIINRVHDGRSHSGAEYTINKNTHSQIVFTNSEAVREAIYIGGLNFPSQNEPPIRISFSLGAYQNDFSNGLYRNSEDYIDMVYSGAGDDQFRTKGKMRGDFFFGGSGVDTLYLEGQKSDYEFSYKTLQNGQLCIQLTSLADPENFMYIGVDVERIRFSEESNKTKGFVKISELMDSKYTKNNPFNLDAAPSLNLMGTQSDDFLTWAGINSQTIDAGWGNDTLLLDGNISDYDFDFFERNYDYDINKSCIYIFDNRIGKRVGIVLFDLENIKFKNGDAYTLKQLKKELNK